MNFDSQLTTEDILSTKSAKNSLIPASQILDGFFSEGK